MAFFWLPNKNFPLPSAKISKEHFFRFVLPFIELVKATLSRSFDFSAIEGKKAMAF